jgi:hypothetical protein
MIKVIRVVYTTSRHLARRVRVVQILASSGQEDNLRER